MTAIVIPMRVKADDTSYAFDAVRPVSAPNNSPAPIWLRYVVALNGVRPPARDDFTYLDLSCGDGLGVNLLAAACPTGQFFGIGTDQTLIDGARRAAANGSVRNAQFRAASLADLDKLDLPDFDFIVSHGSYPWLSDATRQHVHRFVQRKLKPGGIANIGYHSLPGSAASQVLRRLLMLLADGQASSAYHAQAALDRLGDLARSGALFFQDNPPARQMMAELVGINAIYLPEFLSTDWSPSAFDQLLAALAPAGIEFVCSSQIERSYIESVPGSARMALTELSGTPLFDPVRDFIDGAVTRNDIFVKQPNRNFDNLAYFSELHFSSLLPESAIKPELRLGENLIELRGSLYDPLIYWLSLMPITPAELRQHRDLAHFEPAEIIQAIHLLIAARQMLPFAAPAPPFAEIGLANFKIGSDWNRQVLANLAPTMDAVWLASPMAGQGIRLSLSDAWILGGIAAAGTDGATSWLATRLEDPAWATVVPGADLSSSDHRKLAAAIRLREFLETYMLKCLSLGILTT